MRLYRFVISPQSPWATPLSSDTLYGLVCWRVAEDEGPGQCQELIEAFEAARPPFILSSAMPEDRLPMPCLAPLARSAFRQRHAGGAGALLAALQAFKAFRKQSWLPLAAWRENCADLSMAALFDWHCAHAPQKAKTGAAEDEKPLSEEWLPHVSIDRAKGTARDGALFFSRAAFFRDETRLHLYARAEDAARLLKMLQRIGELGFGADAGTGNGRFKASLDENFSEETLVPPGFRGNALMLLSVCAAPDMGALAGNWRLKAKRGKTGPGQVNPFKKTLLLAQEGSVCTQLPAGPYVLRGVAADPAIVQIAWPLTLPCQLSSQEGA